MDEKILNVRMLGDFELVYENEPLTLERSKSTKASQLLQYILYHKDSKISRNKLLNILYARDNVVDPSNNLKVNIFRLRKLLALSGLFSEECIAFQNGAYTWNSSIPVRIDAHRFSALVAKAKSARIDPAEKALLLLKAVRLYSGELLPMISNEEWVAVENIQFKKKYLESIRFLYDYLFSKGEYEHLFDLCEKAATIYPYEESLYMNMLNCLHKLNRYKALHTLYNKVSTLFFDDLGVPPSNEMEEFYKNLCAATQNKPMSLFDIRKKLNENGLDGAYFCNYLAFMDSYHIITHIVERFGQTIFLMLCSLEDSTGGMLGELVLNERIKEAAECLHNVIRFSIRRGDIYSRYSKSQFLVLLTGINQENCMIVSERIHRKYSDESRVKGIRLYYNVIAASDFNM